MTKITDRFTLPTEDQSQASTDWFSAQKNKRTTSGKDAQLHGWLSDEIDILQRFHNGVISTDEAAHAITRPISLSSVPPLGGYSDHALALNDLWTVCVIALVEWPVAYTPNLFDLLDAIRRVPDKIHKGEVLGEDGEQLGWESLPYFNMALYDVNSWKPGEIRQQIEIDEGNGGDAARRVYLRLQDIEAQCFAKQIVTWNNRVVELLVCALEKKDDKNMVTKTSAGDPHNPSLNPGTAYHQQVLSFHVPAAAIWFKYNGKRIYELVTSTNAEDLKIWSAFKEAQPFPQGRTERWSSWKERLQQLADEHNDDENDKHIIAAAAKETLKYMAVAEVELQG